MIDLGLVGSRRVPFVAATALNECGLACLASVSEYFRGEFALVDIRRVATHSGRGETLLEIRNIAEHMGLAARGVRLELRTLAALSTPAILHWDMNHFVLLERVTKSGIVIMDPASAQREVPWAEVDKSFTGVALELKPTERWRRRVRPARKVSVLDFVGPLSHWRKEVALIVALSLLLEVFVLVMPLQMQMSIDNAVLAGDGKLAWVLGFGFALFALIQASVAVMRAWSAAVFGARVGFELRDRFVRALHRKSARFFLMHHTADILNRGRSVDVIQSLVTAQLIQALLDALMSVALLTVMFIAMPNLAILVLGFGLLNVGLTAGLRHAATENSRSHLRVAAKADALFLENARAARAIKLFGKESIRTSVWRNKFVELTNLTLAGGRLNMFSMQGAQATSSLGAVALIATSTYFVINSIITLGTMMMFFVFRAFFVERLNQCVSYLMELRRLQTHAERIDEVMAEEEGGDKETLRDPFVVPPGHGVGIEVRNLWFRYGNDSPWIFRGATFHIEPGECVAITGPSGAGKTTLLHILLGLLEPSRGEVLVNGRNLKTIASYDYAKLIGAVLQDDTLFQGTVAENISFFDAPFDMDRVVHSAEKANIARDIEEMPMQYYSVLAESALNISGGQKQRLFIARAVYHEPKVLFLDEATSHLDSGSERLVSQAVRAMNLTRILIAHRKETIETADRVLYLDQGGALIQREEAFRNQAAL